MTNSQLCSEPLMLPKHALYPYSCLLDKGYSCAENQNLTNQTMSPSSTKTIEMSSNNNKKESSLRHDLRTMQ